MLLCPDDFSLMPCLGLSEIYDILGTLVDWTLMAVRFVDHGLPDFLGSSFQDILAAHFLIAGPC